MKNLLAAALAACAFFAMPASATPSRIDGVAGLMLSDDSPSVVFLNTHTGAGYWSFPRGQWVSVDLKPYGVPADATAALIHGLLLITMGATPGDAALVSVHFRRPGSTADCSNSTAYALAWKLPEGGVRSPFSDFAPLANGVMEVCIKTKWGSPVNNIPLADWEASFNSVPAFGVNARLRGWLK